MKLIAITENGELAKPLSSTPPIAADVIGAMTRLYRIVGYQPPWIGYLALENGACVGTCGFKSPPQNNRVEIAYFTFPEYESRGVATRMAAELIRIALDELPDVTVAAQTLPEENASTSILKKLRFRLVGTVEHPEDGLVWEWQLCYAEDSQMPVVPPGPDSPVDESEPSRDLDTLITDIADHNRENDSLELFSRLPTLHLFLSLVDPLPEKFSHGERILLQNEHLKCHTASVQGLECALSFTSSADPRLNPERLVMIDGLEALQMVLKTTLDGLLIQSPRNVWVVIQRKQIEQILSQRSKPSLLEEGGRLLARIFGKPKRK